MPSLPTIYAVATPVGPGIAGPKSPTRKASITAFRVSRSASMLTTGPRLKSRRYRKKPGGQAPILPVSPLAEHVNRETPFRRGRRPVDSMSVSTDLDPVRQLRHRNHSDPVVLVDLIPGLQEEGRVRHEPICLHSFAERQQSATVLCRQRGPAQCQSDLARKLRTRYEVGATERSWKHGYQLVVDRNARGRQVDREENTDVQSRVGPFQISNQGPRCSTVRAQDGRQTARVRDSAERAGGKCGEGGGPGHVLLRLPATLL